MEKEMEKYKSLILGGAILLGVLVIGSIILKSFWLRSKDLLIPYFYIILINLINFKHFYYEELRFQEWHQRFRRSKINIHTNGKPLQCFSQC